MMLRKTGQSQLMDLLTSHVLQLVVNDIHTVMLQWDTNVPSDVNVYFSRRVQLQRYLEQS